MRSCDTEGTGLDLWHGARPFMFGWCDGLDVEPDCYEWFLNPITREPQIPKRDIAAIKAKLLEPQAEDDGWVLHNPKYDVEAMESLPQWGDFQWPWSRTFDTLLALHLIRSNEPHDLTSGVLKYVGVDIQPFEDRMHEAVLESRKIAAKKFPEWCIAKKGAPGMPSAKEKVWKFDMWLPRQIAAELNYPDDHPWWRVTREYNGADVGTGLALFHVMRDLLKARDLWEIYLERLKLPRIVVKTERKGVTLSADRMAELEDTYRAESAICHDRCVEIAGSFGVELKMPKSGNSKSLLEAAGAVLYSRIGTNAVKPDKVVSVDLPQDEEEEWHHQGSQSQERVKKGQACTFGKFTIYLTPTRNLALSKDVVKSYLSQDGLLPEGSTQREWFENLLAKRKRDTALTYMKGYRNYWLPMGIYNAKGEQAWYLMHPSLNSTGTDTLRWSSSNPNEQNICFDGETEVLTENGWVYATSLRKDVRIAQYWAKSGVVDFVNPTDVYEVHHKGVMKHITTEQHIDMLLTPNHRCLLQDRKTLEKFVVTADRFREECHHFQAGTYTGGGISLSPAKVTWICAVQADGSYQRTDGELYGIRLTFKKPRKIKRLRECLNALGANYSETKTSKGATSFYVGKNEEIAQEVQRLMPDKTFGSWLLDCDRKTLDMFCEEVFLWDGDSTRRGSYSSSTKTNSDWVQILFSLSGSRADLVTRTPTGDWSTKDHHWVNVTLGRGYSGTSNCTIEDVPWDGPVYCVSVPSSFVIIRRNGKVAVTGNSKQDGFNLRYMFGPAPGREWWSLDYENVELRIPAYESGEQAMIDIFEKPDEPPYWGSYHLMNASIVYPDLFYEKVCSACLGKKCKPSKPCGKLERLCDIEDGFKSKYKATWYQYIKNFGFAVGYGAVAESGTADRAAHKVGAQLLVQSKLKKHAALNQSMIDMANRLGYVETIPDRTVNPRRGYPLYVGRTQWGKAKPTTPLNYHVQGTAMQAMAKAMVRTDDYLETKFPDGHIVMQVHDELVFDFPAGKGPKPYLTNLPKIRAIRRLMEQSGEDIGIPLRVAVSYHPSNWSEEVKL